MNPAVFSKDPDTLVGMADIESWESEFGSIPNGSVVIMRSGFGSKYFNRSAYFGWPPGTEANDPADTDNLHFPGFDPGAVEWLAKNRYINSWPQKVKIFELFMLYLG
jgi:kynurenine formamidase